MKETLRKYWMWVTAFAALAVAIGLAALRALFSKPLPPPTPQKSDVQKKADDEFQKRIDDAKQIEEKKVTEANEEHDKAVIDEEKQLEKTTTKIEDDPGAVNEFLKEVGGKVREP